MSKETGKHTVLVIDDELGPRESLRFSLKMEFNVVLADSVDEGVKILQDVKPECVVMDIRMPEKSGIEGLREIREIDPHVSVIMLTGFGALETAQEALRLGANDYLKKPFDALEILKVVRDHSQRTLVQRRRNRAESGLKDLNDRLLGEIEQKEHMASLGQASAEFLHDLRNPLTIVLGYVQLLSEQLLSSRDMLGQEYGDTVDYLDVIEKNVQRCNELAHMWQNYGKTEGGEKNLTPLGPLLQDIITGVEPLVNGRQAEIEAKLNQNGAAILASRPQLLRAFHNIVANAIHAVPDEGGLIRVDCHEEGDDVVVAVEDNGCGVDEETLAKVFEPYFTTKLNGKGTGLGLFITKKIVEDHQGTIEMHSKLNKGTRVHIRLPLAKD